MLMTPTRYISNLFVGVRGSVRYRFNTTGTPGPSTHVQMRRDFGQPFTFYYAMDAINYLYQKWQTGTGEAAFSQCHGEPMFFELPWQCVSQFKPTKVNPSTFDTGTFDYGMSFTTQEAMTDNFEIYQSIGEDFNPVIWNGVPMLSVFTAGRAPTMASASSDGDRFSDEVDYDSVMGVAEENESSN